MYPLAAVASDPVIRTLQTVFQGLVPEIVLVLTACALFVLGTLRPSRRVATGVAMLGLTLAACCATWLPGPAGLVAAAAPALADPLAAFVRGLALVTGAVLILFGAMEPPERRTPEYLGCLLVAVAGVSLAGMANDLITVFLALEMLSIPTYVLLYLGKSDRTGQEAAVKYFMLSVLSSALTLFGFSYLYGIAGVTNLSALAALLPAMGGAPSGGLAIVAAVMVLAGLGFRLTAVPFHFYAPDVYQGGPTAVVSFLSYAPKVAALAVLFRLFGLTAGLDRLPLPEAEGVSRLLWALAVLTMTLGNVLAVLQENVRRMLAYSGVAHAGYMLLGLAVAVQPGRAAEGGAAVLVYLVAYGAMTLGAFGVVLALSTPERRVEAIDDLAGVGASHPWLGACMAVFLLSLIGIPLTAGFAGKLGLFQAALGVGDGTRVDPQFARLVVIAAVNSAIGAYYYLRVLGVMYLRGTLTPAPRNAESYALVPVLFCALVTLAVGVYPVPVADLAAWAMTPARAAVAAAGM